MAIEQNTDTGAVIAMQEECDQLRERVRILREALTTLVPYTIACEGLLNASQAEQVKNALEALEATKEGA